MGFDYISVVEFVVCAEASGFGATSGVDGENELHDLVVFQLRLDGGEDVVGGIAAHECGKFVSGDGGEIVKVEFVTAEVVCYQPDVYVFLGAGVVGDFGDACDPREVVVEGDIIGLCTLGEAGFAHGFVLYFVTEVVEVIGGGSYGDHGFVGFRGDLGDDGFLLVCQGVHSSVFLST